MSTPTPSPTRESEAVTRLRRIVVADAVLSLVAGIFTLSMWATVAPIGWLFWAGLAVLLASVAIAAALLPLRRGDVERSLMVLAIANWTIAIVASTIATFAWPLLMVSSLLPAVVAATFVREHLVRFVVPSLIASLIVTATGTMQEWTQLSEQAPDWLKTAILLVAAPGFGAVLVLAALQHHVNLTAALDEEREAKEREAAVADELRRSRQRVVAATDRERRRIERDLHDGAQSRLVGINLQLAAVRQRIGDDPDRAADMLGDVRDEVQRAHRELRELAHGLYPTVLTQHGLGAAIESAADRSPVSVRLDLAPIDRLPAEHEASLYFVVLEALQNAAKHARASEVTIRLREESVAENGTSGSTMVVEVVDDGIGMADSASPGRGLTNMADRMGAIDGSVQVEPRDGGGTAVVARVPR